MRVTDGHGRTRTVLAVVLVLTFVASAVAVFAQGRGRSRNFGGEPQVSYPSGNIGYDGKVAFVRLRYSSGFGGGFGRRGGMPGWAHDYPTADIHLMKIVDDLTSVAPHVDGSNIFALDDPELLNHPLAYMSEPGSWFPSDSEANGLRTYLLKGGFVFFDDFRGYDWNNLQDQMRRVLPDAHWIQLDGRSRVFHSFFEIDHPESLVAPSIYEQVQAPTYWGLFEDNDPGKRLMAVANVDNDLSEYWEYSDTGLFVVDLANEAYKCGVNYIIYAMTH